MELLIITACAFVASLITLFSGFGLGTVLMPVVAIFFPVPVAVALTALVHLLNNLFKLSLLWRHVDRNVLVRFGVPALLASVPGAWLLNVLADYGSMVSYNIGAIHAEITPVKFAAGLLLMVFATAELFPILQRLKPTHSSLPFGGFLSGFFGGLSGHQGAFRSAFLIGAGLNKDQFVATNAAIASLVDMSRLVVYGLTLGVVLESISPLLITSATIAAFAGALLGTIWLKKVTIRLIQKLVAITLYLLGIALVVGVV